MNANPLRAEEEDPQGLAEGLHRFFGFGPLLLVHEALDEIERGRKLGARKKKADGNVAGGSHLPQLGTSSLDLPYRGEKAYTWGTTENVPVKLPVEVTRCKGSYEAGNLTREGGDDSTNRIGMVLYDGFTGALRG